MLGEILGFIVVIGIITAIAGGMALVFKNWEEKRK